MHEEKRNEKIKKNIFVKIRITNKVGRRGIKTTTMSKLPNLAPFNVVLLLINQVLRFKMFFHFLYDFEDH